MIVTASELRQNVYKLLDQVLETGLPLEIERHGRRLRVIAVEAAPKLDQLIGHENFIVGDPEEFVHIDWSADRAF